MRNVSSKAALDFLEGSPRVHSSNTHVTSTPNPEGFNHYRLFLHGNQIAWRCGSDMSITLAGWNTVTTRERVNALLETLGRDYRIRQVKGSPYLVNGKRKRIISDFVNYSLNEFDRFNTELLEA